MAQVSFSDQILSVVRRRRCCRKLFTFSFSSPEPRGHFQPNLARSTENELMILENLLL